MLSRVKKIILGLLFVFSISFFLIYLIDKRLTVILNQYIDVEVERFTNNIVNKSLNDVMNSSNYNYLNVIRGEKDEIEKISYNTSLLNQMISKVSISIQDKLIELENGNYDDYFLSNRIKTGRFRNIKNGVICDISLGSLRNSTLFANIGPSIPIRLLFMGQINCDIDIDVKEYGINNVMVELFLIVKIKEQVSMPLTSKRKDIVIREPLSIDIIKGAIPQYFNGIK